MESTLVPKEDETVTTSEVSGAHRSTRQLYSRSSGQSSSSYIPFNERCIPRNSKRYSQAILPTAKQPQVSPRKTGGRGGKRPWRANEAHIDEEDDEGDEENGDEEDEWDDPDWREEDEGEEEDEEAEDEVPYELEEAAAEAEAFFTRAKKQRAEIEKARGFFKKGVSTDDRDKGTNPLKAKLACSKCGGLGHWHKDKECPMYGKPFPKKGGGKGKSKKKNSSNYVCSNGCYVTTVNGLDLTHVAYADTACARSVAGQENADSLIAHCRQNNWPYRLVEDREPFRFGPGKRIWSSQALVLAVVWGRISIVIRFSIVPPEVPFLISKCVFKRLGVVLDLDDNQLVLKRFCTDTVREVEPLYDLMSGHVAVELVPEGKEPPKISEETLDLASAGHEVMVNDPELRKKLSNFTVNDNETHVTTVLPSFCKPTVKFDMSKDDTDN